MLPSASAAPSRLTHCSQIHPILPGCRRTRPTRRTSERCARSCPRCRAGANAIPAASSIPCTAGDRRLPLSEFGFVIEAQSPQLPFRGHGQWRNHTEMHRALDGTGPMAGPSPHNNAPHVFLETCSSRLSRSLTATDNQISSVASQAVYRIDLQ